MAREKIEAESRASMQLQTNGSIDSHSPRLPAASRSRLPRRRPRVLAGFAILYLAWLGFLIWLAIQVQRVG